MEKNKALDRMCLKIMINISVIGIMIYPMEWEFICMIMELVNKSMSISESFIKGILMEPAN